MPILKLANFNFSFYDSICSPLNSAPMKIIAKAIMCKVFLILDKSIYNMSIALNKDDLVTGNKALMNFKIYFNYNYAFSKSKARNFLHKLSISRIDIKNSFFWNPKVKFPAMAHPYLNFPKNWIINLFMSVISSIHTTSRKVVQQSASS